MRDIEGLVVTEFQQSYLTIAENYAKQLCPE